MACVTAVVGHSRSSIRPLTEVSISPQAPLGQAELHPGARLALPAHDLTDVLKLAGHALVGRDDFVEGVADLALQAGVFGRQPDREIAGAHRLQGMQQLMHAKNMLVQVPVTWFRLALSTGLGLDGAHESPRFLVERAEVTGLIQVHGQAPGEAVRIGIGAEAGAA